MPGFPAFSNPLDTMLHTILHTLATAFILGSFFALALCAIAPFFMERPQDPR